MSEVKATDATLIHSADDVLDLYTGVDDVRAGIEVEMAFFNPQDADLDTMSLPQNRVLKNAAAAVDPSHDWVHNEPTAELLEVASVAAGLDGVCGVLDDINRKIGILSRKALGLGLKRSYFQELPEKTADDLLSRIVDVERYKVMYAPYRADMKACVEYFAVCKSNQVSVGYPDMEKGFSDIRRLYFMAPFLFLLTDNSSAFSQGQYFSGHAGMELRWRGLTEGRGGLPPHLFTARTGEEFFAQHVDHVMNNPLFMYYDLEGQLQRVPSGDWSVTFNTLKSRGLNTASNYYLAQSLMWPDVKIAALKDDAGDVYAHRYEARMFGVGVHQHQTAFLVVSLLAFRPDLAVRLDKLLARYGFDASDTEEAQALLLQSYAAARSHNGAFFTIAYGSGQMSDFARDFADLIEPVAYAHGLEEEVQPLLTICRSGCTDGKVNRLLFPELSDVLAFQRNYDPEIFNDLNRCARMIFENDIKRLKPDCCAHVS